MTLGCHCLNSYTCLWQRSQISKLYKNHECLYLKRNCIKSIYFVAICLIILLCIILGIKQLPLPQFALTIAILQCIIMHKARFSLELSRFLVCIQLLSQLGLPLLVPFGNPPLNKSWLTFKPISCPVHLEWGFKWSNCLWLSFCGSWYALLAVYRWQQSRERRHKRQGIRMMKLLFIVLIFLGAESKRTFSGKLLSLQIGLKTCFSQKIMYLSIPRQNFLFILPILFC